MGSLGDIKHRYKILGIVFVGFTILIELKKVDVKTYRENYIKGVFSDDRD